MTAVQPPEGVNLPIGGPETWNNEIDVTELQRQVAFCRAAAPNTKEKGDRLESLMIWLLSHVPGFRAELRNEYSADGSQEVDVIFSNTKDFNGFPSFDGIIFGECKNWARPVDSSDVAWFDWKMRLGNVHHGFLFAAQGITANRDRRGRAGNIISTALRDGRTIMVITLDDLMNIQSTEDLLKLIKNKILFLSIQRPFD